ncbi:NYN domain-containing protein [Pararhizobium sp. O133]|uniref:NYN domain-containing protein n=1 Tax=Pararhizobium sp. O133 TaxID=3449278 RepID=UPI003F6880BF
MQSRVVIFIDSENVSAARAAQVFGVISSQGVLVARRAYGDFAKGAGSAWLDKAPQYAIDTVQVCSPAKGKNSSDIRLTIDAVEFLAGDRADTFCLVSGDADFTPLAIHLRGAGKRVIGIGGEKASLSFRQSCDIFHVIGQPEKAAKPSANPVPVKKAVVPTTPPLLPLVQKAIRTLDGEVTDGWVFLGKLGAALRVVKPGFQLKTYGAATLKKALRKEPALELETREAGDFVRIRRKVAILSA